MSCATKFPYTVIAQYSGGEIVIDHIDAITPVAAAIFVCEDRQEVDILAVFNGHLEGLDYVSKTH